MGLWEKINNPNFNLTECSKVRNEADKNGFVMRAKQWAEKLNGIGIVSMRIKMLPL
jgi:hypothetical protein